MRELTEMEIKEVSGGVGPLAIIGVDLALNGVIIGFTSLMTSDYFNGNDS
ncbi:MAG: class IIb bacteriocin, lactobin A/cerein 7B family [Pseudomonadota bacterium]